MISFCFSLEYERETRRHRMLLELRKAKKEVEFFTESVEQKKSIDRIEKNHKKKVEKRSKISEKLAREFGMDDVKECDVTLPKNPLENMRTWDFTQKQTEAEIVTEKRQKAVTKSSKKAKKLSTKTAVDNKVFLKGLFSGGLQNQT